MGYSMRLEITRVCSRPKLYSRTDEQSNPNYTYIHTQREEKGKLLVESETTLTHINTHTQLPRVKQQKLYNTSNIKDQLGVKTDK